MKTKYRRWPVLPLLFSLALSLRAAPDVAALTRADWGAPLVTVSHAAGQWTIAGQKQTVTLNETNLALAINAQGVNWKMFPSGTNDLVVKYHNDEFPLRLMDAGTLSIEPYDTGFKTGVKVTLRNFRHKRKKMDLVIYLT